MQNQKLGIRFFRTSEGREPVREWLKGLPDDERKTIGEDLRTLQFAWPVGMPLVRKLDSDLWELRIDLPNRIARALFTIVQDEAVATWFYQEDPEDPTNRFKHRQAA